MNMYLQITTCRQSKFVLLLHCKHRHAQPGLLSKHMPAQALPGSKALSAQQAMPLTSVKPQKMMDMAPSTWSSVGGAENTLQHMPFPQGIASTCDNV